jgi:hypothetical protein
MKTMKSKIKTLMRKIAYPIIWILVSVIMFQSCQDEPVYPELTWMQTTTISVASLDSMRNFIVELHLISKDPIKIASGTRELGFDLDWESTENPVAKVTLYIQMQEEVDTVIKAYGVDTEKVLAEITEFSSDGKFNLDLEAETVYNLFQDDLGDSRDKYAVPLLPGDFFEIKWRLTGVDGKVLNARDKCFGHGCQYSLSVEGKFWFDL